MDDSADDSEYETDKNGNPIIKKNFAISRLKFIKQRNDNETLSGEVYVYLNRVLGKKGELTTELMMPKEIGDSQNNEFVMECDVVKKLPFVKGTEDQNYGKIWFYFWCADGTVHLYAVILSGKSDAWSSILGIRDWEFPRKFAKTFLNPKQVKKTCGVYLTGKNTGSVTVSYASSSIFDSSDITTNYGIVNEMHASVLDTDIGKQLITYCCGTDESLSRVVGMQSGQIKMKMKELTDIEAMLILKFIDEAIAENENKDTDFEWNFLNYIQQVLGGNKKGLEDILRNDMYRIYRNPDEIVSSFDLNSRLTHPQQDSLDQNDVTLFIGKEQIDWVDNITKKQGYVQVRDVIDAVRANGKDSLKSGEDFENVKIKFYNYAKKGQCSEPVFKLIAATILETDASCFQVRKLWYKVDGDTFCDTNKRFINVIKNHLLEIDENSPEILCWHTKEKQKTEIHFKMADMLSFIACKNMSDDEEKIAIEILDELTKPTSFLCNIGTPFTSEKWESNFYLDGSTNPAVREYHNTHLLDLNVSFLAESELALKISKSFKSTDAKTNKYTQLSTIFRENTSLDEIQKKVVEGFPKSKSEELPKLIEDLKKTDHYILGKDNGHYIVKQPYLTKSIWNLINNGFLKKLNLHAHKVICPVRLIQFLRMFIRMDEADYNELYHLSNCKCRENNEWLYIVGDRIFDIKNNSIELFDVMAYSKVRQEAFLLHVKKDFSADSYRAVCSQVRVSGDLLWKTLTIHSPTNILEKTYDVFIAETDATKSNFHRILSREEICCVGKNKEDFLKAMKSNDMKFKICLTTCSSPKRSFNKLKSANLNYSFKNDFDETTISRLCQKGILSQNTFSITGKVLCTQMSFLNTLKDDDHTINNNKAIFKTLKEKSYGENTWISEGSFVAKVSLIDLQRLFSDYLCHGESRVLMKIIEIPRLQDRYVTQQTSKNCEMNGNVKTDSVKQMNALNLTQAINSDQAHSSSDINKRKSSTTSTSKASAKIKKTDIKSKKMTDYYPKSLK